MLLQCWINQPINQSFFTAIFQVHLSDLVLSQRRDLLEQPLDFYEQDVLPATQPIMSKHYRKTQWFGRLLLYRHNISSPCRRSKNIGVDNAVKWTAIWRLVDSQRCTLAMSMLVICGRWQRSIQAASLQWPVSFVLKFDNQLWTDQKNFR